VSEKPNQARRGRERRASQDALEVEETRGVFMISVAAELADMHPQTLRIYEARGLITPKRSPRNTRLYSRADVERLRKIQRLTSEEGLNLAGVETVLRLEERLGRLREEMARMRERAAEMEATMAKEIERVRKSFRAEIVPYRAYEPGEIVPAEQARPIKIRVQRPGADGHATTD
jgi:MerR family transcriptional regulator, heat shock protein HspR